VIRIALDIWRGSIDEAAGDEHPRNSVVEAQGHGKVADGGAGE